MNLKNRFAVEMRGNAAVVYDRQLFKVVYWAGDVLHKPGARKDAEERAKGLNSGNRCETCGNILFPGHVSGNHVRGEHDERCDKCFGV